MTVKPFNIDKISVIEEGIYGVVLGDKDAAMNCLKKNPRAQVMPQDNGEYVLLYSAGEIDLKRAILKH